MPSLTVSEARARAAALRVHRYDLDLDLDRGPDTFGSRSQITFEAVADTLTFVDVSPRSLRMAELDGAPVDPSRLVDDRLPLRLEAGDHRLVIEADMAFRNDGEGLHRSVDPADGNTYAYAMSFLDAAPSIYACFDQPDLKAPYSIRVTVPRAAGSWPSPPPSRRTS
jgi:aminopeptidase N